MQSGGNGAALAPALEPLVEGGLADPKLLGDFSPGAVARFTGGDHPLAKGIARGGA